MTNTPQCYACVHFDWDAPPRCSGALAFPEGIPIPVQANKHDHSKPYPGDHGVLYEQIPFQPPRGGRRAGRSEASGETRHKGSGSFKPRRAPASPRAAAASR